MGNYLLTHLSDQNLLSGLAARVTRECENTAELLAYIAEVDERKLYLGAGYDSMFTYCTKHLHLSQQSAYKRITAARAARRFPEIFSAVSEGRLHLCGVTVLAPHFSEANAAEFITAATHKSRPEIEMLVAERFPRPDVPTVIRALPSLELSPGRVCQVIESTADNPGSQAQPVGRAPHVSKPSRVEALAPERYSLQTTISRGTRERLQRAKELLSHELPNADPGHIIDEALIALIEKLEKRKLAANSSPRPSTSRPEAGKRYIPAQVRREVRTRDNGQCTFVSEDGHRCESRMFLELDHIQEFARGGVATTENLRLRCRAHNQYAAERSYGRKFMAARRSGRTPQESVEAAGALQRMLDRRRPQPPG